MTEQEIRLECLKIAVDQYRLDSVAAVQLATDFADFVLNGTFLVEKTDD